MLFDNIINICTFVISSYVVCKDTVWFNFLCRDIVNTNTSNDSDKSDKTLVDVSTNVSVNNHTMNPLK